MSSFFDRYPNGVGRIPNWSIKAWRSPANSSWLVQVEHALPERGGWIRGWLVDASGHLQRYPTLQAAAQAMTAFLDHPDWSGCREFPGGVL